MKTRLYGLLAEFDNPTDLVAAAHRTREAGYKRVEAYTPFPVEELTEALPVRRSKLPLVILIGGLIGGVGGYYMQYYANVVGYPLNIGGRPLHSWPSFIPVTFELTILAAALTAVLAMLGMNGLPMPYHPLFNVPRFALASRDRFFLCIEARDPRYDEETTRQFLAGLRPRTVQEVPH
jgi:hypothetical protein